METFNANTSAVPNIFAFLPDDLVKEKERLNIKLFNLKIQFQEVDQENKSLKTIIFVVKYVFK